MLNKIKSLIKSKKAGRELLFKIRMTRTALCWAWIRFVCFVPSKHFRNYLLNLYKGVTISKDVPIYHGFEWWKGPFVVGSGTSIGFHNHFDCRCGLYIGENVDFASNVCIWTQHHDYNSIDFHSKGAPVHIGNYVWVCSHSIILPGVTIGEGAIVASGAVVTSDVAPYTVVGGVPAKKIGVRDKKAYDYMPSKYWIPFHGIALFPVIGEILKNLPPPVSGFCI